MKRLSIIIILVMVSICYAQNNNSFQFKVNRISNNVMTICAMTGNSTITAVNTKKGVVIIDAMWSPFSVKLAQDIINKEFGSSEIKYLINTNSDILSAGGNGGFNEELIIAHEGCYNELLDRRKGFSDYLRSRADEFGRRVTRTKNSMKNIDENSERYKFNKYWLDLCIKVEEDFRQGFEIKLPDITFRDEMKIEMGDVSLNLIHFGETGSKGDIVIYIPEENLVLLGDIFHFHHVLPLYETNSTPDIKKWLTVLDRFIQNENNIKYVIRANSDRLWNIEDLKKTYRLISDILSKTEEADKNNINFSEFMNQISDIEKEFPYVTTFDTYKSVGPDFIISDIKNTAAAYWKKNHKSALSEIKNIYETEGLKTAVKRFNEISSSNDNEFFFIEGDFIRYGYSLLNQNKNKEAVEIFKMAVKMFPESWNTYDSLAEAYMKNNEITLSIKNYKKSLELNPENNNAKEMLIKLEKK